MRYRTLGRTGIQVSPYALGAMNFGVMSNADHDDSSRIIHRALDAGVNLIDTADVYSRGESEEIVGQAIKGRRDDVVLATKFANPMGEAPNQRGASRRWIMTAVEGSLRRLQTDHIDLYQYHRDRHRGDAVGAVRPRAQRQGPRDRNLQAPSRRHRRGALGGRAPWL